MKLTVLQGGKAHERDIERLQTVFDFMLATCDGHAKDVVNELLGTKETFTESRLLTLKESAQDAAASYAALACHCDEVLENLK